MSIKEEYPEHYKAALKIKQENAQLIGDFLGFLIQSSHPIFEIDSGRYQRCFKDEDEWILLYYGLCFDCFEKENKKMKKENVTMDDIRKSITEDTDKCKDDRFERLVAHIESEMEDCSDVVNEDEDDLQNRQRYSAYYEKLYDILKVAKLIDKEV